MTHFCLVCAAMLAGTVVVVGADVMGAMGAVGDVSVVVLLIQVMALLASLVFFSICCILGISTYRSVSVESAKTAKLYN